MFQMVFSKDFLKMAFSGKVKMLFLAFGNYTPFNTWNDMKL